MLIKTTEMNFPKQVDRSHYEFGLYMSKQRWSSVWHQLDQVQKLKPESVLEIGPGPGLFKTIAASFGIVVETLDLDPDLQPDYVAPATAIPLGDGCYDVVCAFQMLEHLPYKVALQAFAEMVRVSRKNVVISLPDSRATWRYVLHVPKLGIWDFLIPRPQLRAPAHVFDGEHYWEINKRDFQLSRVISDLSRKIELVKTFRVPENPYHRFFVFEH